MDDLTDELTSAWRPFDRGDRDDLRVVIDCALAYLTEYGTPAQAEAIDRIAKKYAPDIAEEWRGIGRPSDPPRSSLR